MARRVVITGVGIMSSLGQSYPDVVTKLRSGCSGIEKLKRCEELGFSSTIAGTVGDISDKIKNSGIPKKKLTYSSDAAVYCSLAAHDAILDAQLEQSDLSSSMTGCIVGSGVSGLNTTYQTAHKIYNSQVKRASPYTVCHTMCSSCSASISHIFSIGGRSYSISSACATSSHNIGHSYELIQSGLLDRSLTGGGEEINVLSIGAFCAMRMALSSNYNETPERASRPYDDKRDGFVISGGGGIVILEELERAKSRGAKIYGEIIGYDANTDGESMILPDRQGRSTAKCMTKAIERAKLSPGDIDYINTHGTSTPDGDLAEVNAIKKAFGNQIPPFSSTKSMTGHALGAAGVNEVIYCLAMLDQEFIAPSINIESLDPEFSGLPIITQSTSKSLNIVMSNSFGFGGTNAVLIMAKYNG